MLRNVYFAIFQSIIQHGIIAWGGSTKTNLNSLHLLQKRIIKICLKKRFDYATKLIYSEYYVFNSEQVYKYSLLKLYHKNRNQFILQAHNHDTRRKVELSEQLQKLLQDNKSYIHSFKYSFENDSGANDLQHVISYYSLSRCKTVFENVINLSQ